MVSKKTGNFLMTQLFYLFNYVEEPDKGLFYIRVVLLSYSFKAWFMNFAHKKTRVFPREFFVSECLVDLNQIKITELHLFICFSD